MGIAKNRFLGNINDELICPLCQQVFEEPVMVTVDCQHTFCRNCLHQWMETNGECPENECRQPLEKTNWISNKTVMKKLNNADLLISCEFADFGCDQFIPLHSLAVHTSECVNNPYLAGGLEVIRRQAKENRQLKEKVTKLESELTQCRLDYKAKIDVLEETTNKRLEDLEKREQAKVEKEKFNLWLSKIPNNSSQEHCNCIQYLKQIKLITDWKIEAVLMQLEPKNITSSFRIQQQRQIISERKNNGTPELPVTYLDSYKYYFNQLINILSTLKDSLQFGNRCLIVYNNSTDNFKSYVTYCCALMTSEIYTTWRDEGKESKEKVGVDLENKTIFKTINIYSLDQKQLTQFSQREEKWEPIEIEFDCIIIWERNYDIDRNKFAERLKPGGKMIKIVDNSTNFILIEKLLDGSLK